MRTQEELEEHFSEWISTALEIPAIWQEQTSEDQATPPRPTEATAGAATIALCIVLDGPRRIGMASASAPNTSRVSSRTGDREITIQIQLEGPDAIELIGELLKSIEPDEAGTELLSSYDYALRNIEGPLHLQRQVESTYIRVEVVTITWAFQEGWTRTIDVIETIEGSADVDGIEITFTTAED